jgi:hypothetical protein
MADSRRTISRKAASKIPLVTEMQRTLRDFMKHLLTLKPARLRGYDGPVKDTKHGYCSAHGPPCECA